MGGLDGGRHYPRAGNPLMSDVSGGRERLATLKLKHEVSGKTIAVTLNDFVQPKGRSPVNASQICVQDHPFAADGADQGVDSESAELIARAETRKSGREAWKALRNPKAEILTS